MVKTDRLELAPFDASDYLDSEEVIAEYLAVSLEDPDPDAFLAAVCDVAKARGMAVVAMRRLLNALGVRLDVVAEK